MSRTRAVLSVLIAAWYAAMLLWLIAGAGVASLRYSWFLLIPVPLVALLLRPKSFAGPIRVVINCLAILGMLAVLLWAAYLTYLTYRAVP